MLAEQLTTGDSWLAEVSVPGTRTLPAFFTDIMQRRNVPGREVTVSVVSGALVMTLPDRTSLQVEADRVVADLLQAPGKAIVTWVTHVTREREIGLQCHQFAEVQVPGTLVVSVEDAVAEQVRTACRSTTTDFHTVREWLCEEFTLPAQENGGSPRLVHTGGPGETGLASGFRMHGRRWVADVAIRDDQMRIVRMTDAANRSDVRWPRISAVDVEFVDRTSTAVTSEMIRAALAGLDAGGQSYLELWNDYNEIERESLLDDARSLGWARYRSCTVHTAGRWRFDLAEGSQSEAFLAQLSQASSKIELECSDLLPAEFKGGKGGRVRSEHGSLAGVGQSDRTVFLAIDEDRIPEPSGYLYKSLAGDRTRLARRDEARERIENNQAEMPELRLLLEGASIPRSLREFKNTKQVLTSAVRAVFGDDEPTRTQLDALRMAVATPDILLVQGPPGTGKTQFITALLACLDQLGDRTIPMHRTLISSFQHSAVDNVTGRARHHGLPPTRVSPSRDVNLTNVREWRDEVLTEVDAYLTEHRPEVIARDKAVQVRRMVSAYHTQPANDADLADLLREVRKAAEDVLPPILLSKLNRMRAEVVARSQFSSALPATDRREAAAVIRSLRTTKTAFDDDGPQRAAFALKALDRFGLLDATGRDTLSAASTATISEPELLAELEALQGRLLDSLRSGLLIGRTPTYDPDVDSLLQDVADAVDEAYAESGDGIDEVLRTYREALQQDLGLVEETLTRYNAVLAATVQQAKSDEMSRILDAPLPVFDTVIVDEAARANPLDLMIPLSCARKRIILVGDHKQLPHSLEQKVERELRQNRGASGVSLTKSLFERWFDTFSAERPSVRTIRLDMQFRMHESLGRFVSRTFYGGPDAISSHPSTAELTHRFVDYAGKTVAWIDVPGSSGKEERVGTSYARPVEAERLAAELRDLAAADHERKMTFGVITFYREQQNEIEEALITASLGWKDDQDQFRPVAAMALTSGSRPKPRLSVGTVDAFQGMEFDVVLLSITRSSGPAKDPGDRVEAIRRYGHLLSDSRMCVAMSRQRRLLIAVGDAAMARRGSMPNVPGDPDRSVAEGIVGFLEFCQGVHGAGVRS
ncbi:DEAD/DEAH box helicase [Lentzea californiensis]|uniref:DEAD/DEAH box helicase n=1 Tax=Lentzea californiensis TaxID=438851 RepID=UPI002166ACAB|nr:AAA domain-containing protein [Lentzea californiensis]